MSEQKSTTDLKSIITIVVVVSFVVSVLTGFIAAGIGYNLISSNQEKTEQQNQKQAEENSGISSDVGSGSVVDAVEKVSPAVVSIIVTKDLPVMERYYEEFGPFGLRVPRYRQEGTEERQIGGGTGFIVSSDGLILTNKHVVSDEEAEYTVLTNDEQRIPAKVLARDPVHDIAVLKIDKKGLSVVELGDSENLKIGQKVIAIGNALGEFRNTVSTGVVSGLRRSIKAQSSGGQLEQLSGLIQTDAAVNQGNSGGPLLNLRGEAVGINVAMAQSAENIGFALPIERAKRDLEQVRQRGEIAYPFLGVRYVMINSDIQEKNNLEVDHGALILRGDKEGELAVVPGSPADKAGLRENDIILEVNEEKVNRDNSLSELIQKYKIGEKITLKVWSKGETESVEVTLGER